MSQGDIRRHPRTAHPAKVRISWIHSDGQPRFAQARCVDQSEGGVRVEAPEPLPVRSYVVLHSDQMKFGGGAVVKHVTRQGLKYTLGLALSSRF